MEHEVIVLPSALKRGFRARDIVQAVRYAITENLSEDGYMVVSLIGDVPVEIIGRYSDNDDLIVFHCMKCRKKYLYILESYYGH